VTILELCGLTKRYPGVTALDRVDLTVRRGTIHALVGENGAGKSTLLKLIAGAEQPDAGTIALDGSPIVLANPGHALRRGVTVIYQELSLVPQLSIAANVFLGMERSRHGLLDRHGMDRAAEAALAELGLDIDPRTTVGGLSIAQQQLVELARALIRDARLIALDEPTSALTPHEVAHLFRQVGRLKESGVAVIFVSHRLDEVRQLADTVTVLRDGRHVWSGPVAERDDADLIRAMVGRDVEYERQPRARAPDRESLLEVRALTRRPHFENVSLDLRRGEILGIAGLVGSGRTDVARAVAGIDPADAGAMVLDGEVFTPATPRQAIDRGVVYFPEDRKRDGLVLDLLVRENVTLPTLSRYAPRGRIRRGSEVVAAHTAVRAIDLRPPEIERPAHSLSGGNQQKVVLAKWLLAEAHVLLFDEPTRGVDVGAKVELHRQIRQLADSGKAVMVISSELPEILALADRVVVMREGHVTGELGGPAITAERIMTLALGAS
jgi:ABC-type sugar transport system ATPase subunit